MPGFLFSGFCADITARLRLFTGVLTVFSASIAFWDLVAWRLLLRVVFPEVVSKSKVVRLKEVRGASLPYSVA